MYILSAKFRKAVELRRKIRLLRKGIEGLKSEDPYEHKKAIYNALEVYGLDFIETRFVIRVEELKHELETL